MPGGLFAAGVLDQDTPHGLGRRREEMLLAVPALAGVLFEAQPSLMHQCRGLEGVAGRFARHVRRRQAPQLFIYLARIFHKRGQISFNQLI